MVAARANADTRFGAASSAFQRRHAARREAVIPINGERR